MSLAMWKLEKDLCRCCHAEGSFKHLSDPCFQLGQEEIYSDMLQDCLDVKIVPMTGPLSEVTYTICESCVSRLRDAANFKRQVQDCEERFKDMYSKNLIKGFQVKEEPEFDEADAMKQEYQSIGDDDDDESFMKFDDDADADDSLDEQMITIEVEAGSKGKGKGKAKPKPPKKAAPVKKPVDKLKVKPVKMETEELTEAAVSGEKKKGEDTERKAVCEITPGDDGAEIFKCLACGRTYNNHNNFTQHYRHIHLKLRKKTFPCPVCGVQLYPHKKAAHLEAEHGRSAPTCNVCGKKFITIYLLSLHQRLTHMGEREYHCDMCGKSFSMKKYLERHMNVHSDVKNYACDTCGKRFKWKKNLQTHVDIHLNVRKFVCAVCAASFIQPAGLKYHMTSRHPNID